MFNEVYQTTPCITYPTAAIRSELEKELIDHTLGYAQTSGTSTLGHLYTVPNSIKTSQVGVFQHPMVIKNIRGESVLVIDTRAFTSARTETTTSITGLTEYNFLVLRARLQWAWMKNGRYDLMSSGDLAPMVFSRWISEAVTRRLNMTPQDQLKAAILAAVYYFDLFYDAKQLNDEEELRVKIAVQAARACHVSLDKVLEVTDLVPPMTDITSFINGLKTVVPSERTEMLSVGLLYSILGGSWFGNNARELVAVALEYPPVFLSMIYVALTDRSYHRSFLAELVERTDKRGQMGKSLIAHLTTLLEVHDD